MKVLMNVDVAFTYPGNYIIKGHIINPKINVSKSHIYQYIYKILYNSVCARRHKHINCPMSAPLNATKIAVKKGIHRWMPMVGPEFFWDLQMLKKNGFFLRKVCSSQTNPQ